MKKIALINDCPLWQMLAGRRNSCYFHPREYRLARFPPQFFRTDRFSKLLFMMIIQKK